MTVRRILCAAIALWAASGLLAMHAFTAAAPHTGHGDHEASAETLGLCVFILAGGGVLTLAGIGPAPTAGRLRHRPISWSRARFVAPLLPRRRPVAWCVLRA